jgi:SnoaL-like domain
VDNRGKGLLSLEERLSRIEDRLAIYNLIASHPLSADTGIGSFFPHLYTKDAIFDRGALHGANCRDSLVAMVESPAHKAAMDGGLAHFGNLPFIELDGDTATVTSYIMLVTFDRNADERELANHGTSNGHSIFRVVSNRWTVVRTDEGWRIKVRKVFAMDGSPPARELLADTVSKYA